MKGGLYLLTIFVFFFIGCIIYPQERIPTCVSKTIDSNLVTTVCSRYDPKGFHTINAEYYTLDSLLYRDTVRLFCHFQKFRNSCNNYIKLQFANYYPYKEKGIEQFFYTDNSNGYKYFCYDIEQNYLVLKNTKLAHNRGLYVNFKKVLAFAFEKKDRTWQYLDSNSKGELVYDKFTQNYQGGNINELDSIKGIVEAVWIGMNKDSVIREFIKPKIVVRGCDNYHHRSKASLRLDLLKPRSIYFTIDNKSDEVEYEVLSFRISFFDKNKKTTISKVIEGSKFSEYEKDIFSSLRPNQGYFISEVKLNATFRGVSYKLEYLDRVFNYKYFP